MNIEYQARNFSMDQAVRDYAAGKLAKALKFLEEPVDIRVTLEVEKHRKIAELHVAHRHGVLQAAEETDEMRDAINLAADKIEKQARRSREKHQARRRRAAREQHGSANEWPVDVLERSSLAENNKPQIIKSSVLSIKPMSLEEAALMLENAKNGFVVFRDSGNDRINVLYRRRDENYGLISPDL